MFQKVLLNRSKRAARKGSAPWVQGFWHTRHTRGPPGPYPAIYCRETRVFRTIGPALTPETRTISLSEPLRAEPSGGVCDRPPASHMTDFRLPCLWHQLSRYQWFPVLGVLKPRGNLSLWPFLRLHGFIHLCRKVWKKGSRGAKTGRSGLRSRYWEGGVIFHQTGSSPVIYGESPESSGTCFERV